MYFFSQILCFIILLYNGMMFLSMHCSTTLFFFKYICLKTEGALWCFTFHSSCDLYFDFILLSMYFDNLY